jgi:periplasmic protein TonB
MKPWRQYKKILSALLLYLAAAVPGLCGPDASAPDAQPDREPVSAYSTKSNGRAIPLITIFGSSEGPKFEERAAPEYPFSAKKRGLEGTVLLRLNIDELGILQNVEVVEATDPVFIEAAVASVKKSFFVSAKSNHRSVASQALLPIHFKLKK